MFEWIALGVFAFAAWRVVDFLQGIAQNLFSHSFEQKRIADNLEAIRAHLEAGRDHKSPPAFDAGEMTTGDRLDRVLGTSADPR